MIVIAEFVIIYQFMLLKLPKDIIIIVQRYIVSSYYQTVIVQYKTVWLNDGNRGDGKIFWADYEGFLAKNYYSDHILYYIANFRTLDNYTWIPISNFIHKRTNVSNTSHNYKYATLYK